jgi:hypothetical protein
MNVSTDYDKLIDLFLDDIEELVLHHHDMVQSVDKPNQLELGISEKPEVCPFCKEKPENWEYNHSHFLDDNLNKHLNCYICDKCNKKAMVRNKPLKFYAHNGSKFDFNLFIGKMLNDPDFKNCQFLAKTESRFTQVEAYIKNPMYKFSINDSMMLLVGGLAGLTEAWVTETEKPLIKSLIENFYECEVSDDIVNLSLKKAIFPYSALNKPKQTKKMSEPLPEKWFYDDLRKEAVSTSDYKTYKNAYKTLQNEFDDFTFGDYHNFYLLLDIVSY